MMANVMQLSRMEKIQMAHIRFWKLVLMGAAISVTSCAVIVWASFHVVTVWQVVTRKAESMYHTALQRVTRVEVRREIVRSDSVPLTTLIDSVAGKYNMPSVILRAVVEQESGGGENLYRFEPAKYGQLKTKLNISDSEVRMLASSHGVAHVMGFNAMPKCGVHWSKLYDPAIGLECGAKLLTDSLERYRDVKEPAKRVWFSLRDYNGTGPDAEAYAGKVMARIGALMLGDIGKAL